MSEISQGLECSKISISLVKLMQLATELQEKYPEAMGILDITGVSPFGSWEMMNPYTKEADFEDFSNVGRHCIAVAYAANKIADALWIPDEQKDAIITSAILHDGDKRIEVMRKKAKKAWGEIDVYWEEWYKTIETLFSDKGLDPRVFATIQSMGGMTGHNSLKKFLIMKDRKIQLNPERTLAEMIVHIADDMTHSSSGEGGEVTQYVSFNTRASLSKFPEKYGFLWQEGFTVSEDNGIQEIRDITWIQWDTVKHFYDWQAQVFEMICEYIQNQMDPTSQIDSVEFLLGIVNVQSTKNLVESVTGKVDKNLPVV